ncbi:MAG: hypothetical protein ACAH80_17645 [Alphaproteobacteria bacterium]
MGLFSSRPAPALLDDESLEKRYKWSNRTVYTGLAAMIFGSLARGMSVASLIFPAIVPTLPSLIGAVMIWGGLQVYSSNFKDARACGAEKLSRLQAKVAAEQEAHANMPEPAAPEFNTRAAITLDTAMRVKHALKIKPPGGLFPA